MTGVFYFVAVFILLFCNHFILCMFHLEELKSINYEVDILKTPVKAGEEQFHPVLHMKSKYGQEYQCLLPHIEDEEATEKRESVGDENVDIKELLKPFQSSACLLKTKGWWTYEFCFGQYIKQYHIEDGKVLGQVNTLGLYESDYDWNNETDESKFRHTKQRYHSQLYSNGSKCDLTGLPRSAEVRFYCEEDAGGYIYRVDEPGTCIYVLTVHTARICSHPKLKPLPTNKAHVVSCSPVLDEKQYSQYLQKVEEEKFLAGKKRSKWLANQQERLKAMKFWTMDGADMQKDNFEKFQMLGDSYSESLTEYSQADGVKKTETGSQVQSLANSLEKNGDYLEKKLWKEYDLEKKLLKEYEQEVEKLKSLIPPERFSSVKDDLLKHLDSLINEAEEELEVDLDSKSKEEAFSELASKLNILTDKLDKAEKDVAETTYQTKEAHSVIAAKMKAEQIGKSDSSDGLYSHRNLQDQEHDQSAVFDDDKLHVRIRRLDRKSPNSGGELHEMDFAQRKQLEQAVKEKLEKSGLDTGGRRIEVKIITAGYYDNEDGKDFHSLSDEETDEFQNMIMALLTGQQEAVQEMERHKKLEENYKYVWNGIEQPESDDEDDE